MGEDELCNSSFNLIVNDINILQQWEVLQWARKDAGNSIVGEVDILQARQVLNLKWNRSIKTYLRQSQRLDISLDTTLDAIGSVVSTYLVPHAYIIRRKEIELL